MAKLIIPVAGVLTQRFGSRPEYYKQFGMSGHEGVDWGAAIGTPVLAADRGYIRRINHDNGSHAYGNHIRMIHMDADGNRFETIYAHLDSFRDMLRAGEWVDAGAVIGYVGNTGNSTGPHLHFSMKWWDKVGTKGYPQGVVDPTPFFVEKV